MAISQAQEKDREPTIKTITWGDLTWTDIVQPTEEAKKYLAERYHFHPLALDDGRRRDHRHRMAAALAPGLEQERDVEHDHGRAALARAGEAAQHLGSHARVHDRVQALARLCIAEDERAQGLAVELARGGQDLRPEGIRQLGSRGSEIKRFKGLGEMNPEELWETTLDPTKRSLIKVVLSDDAGDDQQFEVDAHEADRLFSILMGDDVDSRRTFIEQNALHVKDLDV